MSVPFYCQFGLTHVVAFFFFFEKAVAIVFSAAKSVYKLHRGPLILVISVKYHEI